MLVWTTMDIFLFYVQYVAMLTLCLLWSSLVYYCLTVLQRSFKTRLYEHARPSVHRKPPNAARG